MYRKRINIRVFMREYIFSILPKKVQNRIIRHFPPFLKTFEVKFPDNISNKIKNIDNLKRLNIFFGKDIRVMSGVR